MAIVKKYPAKVVSVHSQITGVYTLEFESLGKPFKYEPGQFLHLALDEYDPSGQWPDSRCFSMHSSPEEPTLKISYAAKGKFTSKMEKQLQVGSEITLKLPYGDLFTQPHNKQNTVFIAGGTGITPFLSLFTHKSFNDYTNPHIYLGFRSKEYNIYQDELEHMQTIRAIRPNSCNSHSSSNSSKFVKSFFQDEDGIIDIHQIFNDNGITSDYFISGPPVMIKAFKQALIAKGVPSFQIKADEWE